MSKKKNSEKSPNQADASKNNGHGEHAEEPNDAPEVEAAAEAVRRAEEELAKAQAYYLELREQAVEHIQHIRESQVGDVIDATLRWVRKHPGGGVLIAGLVGLFLGRLFRR